MAIVASNSITVSNVNDGTITHTAYAYSSDGTDRFTTVYPNLNLLSGTSYKTQINDNHYMTMPVPTTGGYSGNNYISANYINGTPGTITDWARFYIRQQAVPDFQYIQANTTYTVSLWARGSGTSSIYVWSSVGAVSNPATANKTINLTNVWQLFTLTFNSASSIPDNSQIFIRTPAGSNIDICLPKLEQGSTATPYMPSSSEVTTADYPKYKGEYSDLLTTQSTNPSDYKWELNIDALSVSSAFAYSADGTDRFTTVYPNLNLLSNTTFKNYTPKTQQYFSMTINDGGVNNKPYVSASYTNPTANSWTDTISWNYPKEYFKPSTTYTFSFYLRGSGAIKTHVYPSLIDSSSSNGLADGKVITPAVDGYYNWNLTNEWVRHTYTFVSKSSITSTQIFLFRIYTGNSVDICLPKVEEGSTATSWMPSSSEVQPSDYPSYIGRALKYSTKPSDYNWEINSGYTDAKVDVQQTRVTQLSQDLSGFKTTVSNTYLTKTDATNTYPTKTAVTTQINQSATDITSSVQTWTNNKLTAYSTTQQTATSITNAVASKADKTQITQLSDNINLKVSKGDVVSQINVEAGQILFNSNKLVLNANTTEIAGDAFISGDMIVDGTIKGKQLDVDKISSIANDLGEINAGSYTSWSSEVSQLSGLNILSGIYLFNGRIRNIVIRSQDYLLPDDPIGDGVSTKIDGTEQSAGTVRYFSGSVTLGKTPNELLHDMETYGYWSVYDIEGETGTSALVGEVFGYIEGPLNPTPEKGIVVLADNIMLNGKTAIYGDAMVTGSLYSGGRNLSTNTSISVALFYGITIVFRRQGNLVVASIARQFRTTGTTGEDIMTNEKVPSGYRPSYSHYFDINRNSGSNVIKGLIMGIASNGDVRVTIGETGPAVFSGSTSYFTTDPLP